MIQVHSLERMTQCAVILVVLGLSIISTVESSVCTSAERTNDEAACLQAIGATVNDKQEFWFGTKFAERCPLQERHTISCITYGAVNQSMADKLFKPADSFDGSGLDRYMDITVISEPGEYTGCSHHYSRDTKETYVIDPLAEGAIKPWDAREMPEVSWRSDTDKQYTLIVQDVGFGFIHGIYMNIPGDNISAASVLVVDEYSGPLNFRDVPNPYAFVLYEQATVNMDKPVYAPLDPPMLLFSMSDFATVANLQGPIAINWLQVSFDPYSVQTQKDAIGMVENCGAFTSAAIQSENFPFIGSDELPLVAYMEMTITSTELDFTLCCETHKSEAGTVIVDPMSDKLLTTAQTRSGSQLNFSVQKNKFNPNSTADFKDLFLTVVTVDPDVPYDTVGTLEKPLLHYLAYNFKVNAMGKLVDGVEVLAYGGPTPPDTTHRYVTLVYIGGNSLDSLLSTDYTGECEDRLKSRCLFDLEKLRDDNSLTLLSATFFRATRDPYVEVRKNDTITTYCDGLSGGNPCTGKDSTSGSAGLTDTLLALIISAILCTFMRYH